MNPWKRIDDTDVYDGFPISSYRIEQFLYDCVFQSKSSRDSGGKHPGIPTRSHPVWGCRSERFSESFDVDPVWVE